ncbi:MAG TPA: hypothetical protein VKX46_01480 [Ktedonobacteraceae bacterium]|nr:hypothetical protein [Ktedonobacteraceae bacterium]
MPGLDGLRKRPITFQSQTIQQDNVAFTCIINPRTPSPSIGGTPHPSAARAGPRRALGRGGMNAVGNACRSAYNLIGMFFLGSYLIVGIIPMLSLIHIITCVQTETPATKWWQASLLLTRLVEMGHRTRSFHDTAHPNRFPARIPPSATSAQPARTAGVQSRLTTLQDTFFVARHAFGVLWKGSERLWLKQITSVTVY